MSRGMPRSLDQGDPWQDLIFVVAEIEQLGLHPRHDDQLWIVSETFPRVGDVGVPQLGLRKIERCLGKELVVRAMIEMKVGVNDDVDLFRSHPDLRQLCFDRLFLTLLRFLERELPFHPRLIKPGVDHDLPLGMVDIERVDREAELDPLSVIPGGERLVEHQRAVVEQIDLHVCRHRLPPLSISTSGRWDSCAVNARHTRSGVAGRVSIRTPASASAVAMAAAIPASAPSPTPLAPYGPG